MSLEAHTLVVTKSRHNYKVEAAGGHCTELHQAQPSSLTQPDATLASKLYITLYCAVHLYKLITLYSSVLFVGSETRSSLLQIFIMIQTDR